MYDVINIIIILIIFGVLQKLYFRLIFVTWCNMAETLGAERMLQCYTKKRLKVSRKYKNSRSL